jgi:hypothetical protein
MSSPMRPRNITPEQVSVQAVGTETLLYDELHHKAWCLNHSSACIWRLCDGERTIEQIATAAASELNAPVTAEIVLLTLAELREKELVEPESTPQLPDGMSRRQMIGKTGIAAAALLPVVASILAPSALALSGTVTGMSRQAKNLRDSLK